MLILAASQTAQPDYAALAMVLVLALIVAVMTIRKYLANKKAAQAEPAAAPAAQPAKAQPTIPAAPGSAGHLKLHDVDPRTAAMAMAIVADKLGKPLNELRFISIKEVK